MGRKISVSLAKLLWRIGQGVLDDGEWCDLLWLDVLVYQEALAVFGYVVGEKVGGGNRGTATDLEERSRRARGKRFGGIGGDCHQGSGAAEIKDLFAVAAPTGFVSAATRDLPFSG